MTAKLLLQLHLATRDMSTSDDLNTAAGFMSAGSCVSLLLTTPDSLDLGEQTRLTSGLFELLGSGGRTRGDWTGFD